MSNQAAMQYQLDLTGGLDLNQNKNTIRQFEGFVKRNSPYINGGVSPLMSNKGIEADIIKKNGKEYKLVKEDNTDYWTLEGDNNSPKFYSGITSGVKKNPAPQSNCFFLTSINGDDVFILNEEGKVYTIINGVKEEIETDYTNIRNLSVLNTSIINTGTYPGNVIYGYCDLNYEDIEYHSIIAIAIGFISTPRIFTAMYKTTNSNLKPNGVILNLGTSNRLQLVYMFNDTNELLGNVVRYVVMTDNPDLKFISGYNAIDSYGNVFSMETSLTSGSTYNTLNFVGKASISLADTTTNTLTVNFNNPYSYRFYKTLSGNNYAYATAVGANTDVKFVIDPFLLGWSVPVTLSNGETMFFFNGKPNGQVIDDEGNMSINTKTDLHIDITNAITNTDIEKKFSYIYNNNVLSGISYEGILLSNWLEIDTSNYLPYAVGDNIIYQTTDKNFVEINLNLYRTVKPTLELMYDNYIIIKGVPEKNKPYTTLDGILWSNISSDWNNRICLDCSGSKTFTLPTTTESKYLLLASGHNSSYENNNGGICSAQFAIMKYRYIPLDDNPITSKFSEIIYYGLDTPGSYGIELYLSDNEEVYPEYVKTLYNTSLNDYSYKEIIENKYLGTTYPVQTDNNILLNPAIIDSYYISGLMYDSIKTPNEDFYKLIYSDAQPVLLYAYGTNIRDVSDIFFIQGQLFVVRNDIICSAVINGNSFESITPIVNKGDLLYLGCSPTVAYFYSATDRYIYAFTGDRNLQKYVEISEFTEIRNSMFLPDITALLLATDNGLYVINSDDYIYCVEGDYKTVTPLINGFAGRLSSDKWNEYYYYNDTAEGKEKVNLRTSFYGVGNNQVSIVDTWYIKLFSPVKANGKVNCKIETITDISKTSNEQDFTIEASQWDNNGFIYIRYQPQLQRGVAASLEITSDFEVYDLQASIIPDNTKQLSADYRQKVSYTDNSGI